MAKSEKSRKGVFSKKLITAVNMSCKYAKYCIKEKFMIYFFEIVPRIVYVVVSDNCKNKFILLFNNL